LRRQVSELKKTIEETKNMTVQKLIYLGKILDEDKTLGEIGVKETSFVVCMGGPKKAAPAPAPAPPPAAAAPAPAPPVAAADPPAVADPPAADAPADASADAPADAAPPAEGPGAPSPENLAMLKDMGFPEDECRRALAAALNDPDRAVQYLMEGIPEGAGQMAAQAPASGTGGGGGNPLDALRQHPQFAQLRAQLQADPQALPQVLQGFGASNPQVAQLIQANLPAFIEMMGETDDAPAPAAPQPGAAPGAGGLPGMPPGMQVNPQMLMQLMQMLQQMPPEQQQQMLAQTGLTPEMLQQMAPLMQQMAQNPQMMQQMMAGMGGAQGQGQGGGPPPGQVQIQLAPEDVAAIDGLAEMTGFDKNDCLQAYMACDKNADQAANLLFTNPPESDDPPPGAPPGGQ